MKLADEIAQSEKRRILAEDRRARTYHAVAQGSIDDERGGRYGAVGRQPTVTGRSAISYPQQPPTSPWFSNPMPSEPPLGYSVDAMEPVGEPHERGNAADEPSNEPSNGDVPVARIRLRRRICTSFAPHRGCSALRCVLPPRASHHALV